MPVSFESINIGTSYSRPYLANIWGYQTHQAISRGIVTPKNSPFIILFVTNIKQTGYVQYKNMIHDNILYTEGETTHTSDKRIIESSSTHQEIHLFYRERHHSDFTYYGRVYLVSYQLVSQEPSRFMYAISEVSKSAYDSVLVEVNTHGLDNADYEPDEEGKRKIPSACFDNIRFPTS